MDNPELYLKSNSLQTEGAKSMLCDYIDLIKWNQNGEEVVLDIGCGTGNVTCEILVPFLPNTIKEVWAVDINKKMIETARKRYGELEELIFETLDIGEDIPMNFVGKFDHIFSFFCFHWVRNQKKLFKNIYSLLKPGGDILFCMVGKYVIHDIYLDMSRNPRWHKYMKDVKERSFPPYQEELFPSEALRENLELAGFKVEFCEDRQSKYLFINNNQLKDFFQAINPFIKGIPEEDREDFMNQIITEVKKYENIKKKINNRITTCNYDLLVGYAKKN